MVELIYKSDSDVELIDHMGDDARIAMAAWVSTSAAEGMKRAVEKPDDVKGVINYLAKHRHGTPFEAGVVQLFVRAPIFVWREWHRHRIASYNEESARYKTLDPVFFIPSRDRPMIKVDGWKPGRPKFRTLDDDFKDSYVEDGQTLWKYPEEQYSEMVADMKKGYEEEYARYLRQLERRLDPGLARDNLPVGIYSSCWVTFNVRALMGFLSLRTHEPEALFVSYPLAEIDAAARKVETIFASLFPITHKAFCDNRRVGP